MIELTGDLWYYHPHGYICITTNGMVKSNGECVMGRGVAYQATQRFPGIARELGSVIQKYGNHVHVLSNNLVSFPVKHHWKDQADPDLIKRSVLELVELFGWHEDARVYLPRPGCGNGRLRWTDVKPLLENLTNQFIVVNLTSS